MSELQTPDEGTEQQEGVTPVNETQVEETTQTQSEEVSTDTQEENEETTEQTSSEPQPAQPDYKQKFVDSSRESILNAERIKVKDAQIESLTKTDTPTDEAMRQLYPDWDTYNDIAKKAFIRQESQEMRQRKIEAQQQEIIDRQKLEDELETVIDSNPRLQGKAAEFKRFAKNPKNRGINAETLAKAYLFDVEEETPTTTQQPQPTEALPTGSGGPRGDLKPKKISLEEAAEIRKTDYNRYMELVKTGQIEELE